MNGTQTLIDPRETHSGVVASRRDLPWITKNSIAFEDDDPTVEQALKAAGLDFEVASRKVYTTNARGHRLVVPGFKANVRTDTEAIVGIVGDRYTVLQNASGLAIGDDVRRLGGRIEASISLRGGKLVGIMAELPEFAINVPGDDSGYKAMLGIFNSHDGNSSVTGAVGMLRLRCLNAVTPFLRGAIRSFKVRHTSSVEIRTHEAERLLVGVQTYVQAYEREAARLAGITLAEQQVRQIFEAAFPIREEASEAQRANSTAAGLFLNWRNTETLDESLKRTGWGVVQAAAEYVEHVVDYKGRTYDASDVRAYSILYGTGALAVQKVLAAVQEAA